MRKRHLAAAAAVTISVTAFSQAPAFAADAPSGTLLHQVISTGQAGWQEPAGSAGVTQASITGLPNGSSQLVAVNAKGSLEHDIRFANGSWQGWNTISQPGVTAENAGIAGMSNGSAQLVEVTSTGVLKHDVRNANGSWQTGGWATPAGSTGITQASITALPNGSSEIVAVTTTGTLELDVRYANGSWKGWDSISQPGVTVANASIAGMPNGSSQFIEVTSTGALEYNALSANGSWQAGGWTTPAIAADAETPISITQASITALPNGSSQIAVATGSAPGFAVHYANGSWSGWAQLYQRVGYSMASELSIAGMPNGTSQVIAIAES